MRRAARQGSIVIALAILASLLVATQPAFARDGFPSAELVDPSDLVAGTAEELSFKVTNPMVAVNPGAPVPVSASPINWISIGLLEFPVEAKDFSFSGGEAEDWTAQLFDDHIVFSGGTIQPGEFETFSTTAELPRIDGDSEFDWSVETATDGKGDFVTHADESFSGALTSHVRTLTIDSVSIVAPAGATDRSVTVGQGFTVGTRISNHSTGDREVTVEVQGAPDDVGPTVPLTVTVPMGASPVIEHPFVAGETATRFFRADASAPGAVAFKETPEPVTALPEAVVTYDSESLSPRTAPPGTAVAPTVEIAKEGPQEVALEDLTLTLSKEGSAPMIFSSSAALPPGNQDDFLVSFPELNLPGEIGSKDVSTWDVDLAGTAVDENDAERTIQFDLEDFMIDGAAPLVQPTLTPPTGRNGIEGPAATEGDTLTIGGTIGDGAHESGAIVLACEFVVAAAGANGGVGDELVREPLVGSSCASTEEGLAGELQVPEAGTGRAIAWLEISARDAAGNLADGRSANLPIDNDVPSVTDAVTGCGPDQAGCLDDHTLRLRFSEPLTGAFSASDFSVPGHVVTDATSPCGETFCDRLMLTFGESVGSNETFTIGYKAPENGPGDGVGHALSSGSIEVRDGIAPEPPVLEGVSQAIPSASGGLVDQSAGAYDGTFFTNDRTPFFTSSGLTPGDESIVAVDLNGTRSYEADVDEKIASCLADASVVACPAGEIAAPQNQVLVVAVDPSGNPSDATAYPVELDQSPPEVSTLRSVDWGVEVQFTEPLRAGRDEISDWRAFSLSDGRRRAVSPSSIVGSGSMRTLQLSTTGTFSGVDYSFEGEPSDRYRDRAGNRLANFTLSLGAGSITTDELVLEASPREQSRFAGSVHVVRFAVHDHGGIGVERLEVDLMASGGPSATRDVDGDPATPPGYIGECITDRDGCSIAYSSSTAGNDRLAAWIDLDSDDMPDELGRSFDREAFLAVYWVEPPGSSGSEPAEPSPQPTSTPTVGPRDSTGASLVLSASDLEVGDSLVLDGALDGASQCRAGRSVLVEVTTAQSSRSRTVTTDEAGLWQLQLRPRNSATYRATALETERCATASSEATVQVHAVVELGARSKVIPRGSCTRLTGRIRPARDASEIGIQRRKTHRWAVVARVPIIDSYFSWRKCFPSSGTKTFRAVWGGDALNAPAKTSPVSLKVH